MDSNNAIKIKRNDDAVWRVIDGEVVVLLPQEKALHALTGCGSRIWELIEGETSITEIIKKICDEYDVELERARLDITEYFHKLEAMKLVELVPEVVEEASR